MDQEPKSLSEDTSVVINLLTAFLNKAVAMVRHLDVQTNILIGISSAIFLFSATRFFQEKQLNSLPFLITTLSAGLSSFIGLLAIHPPRFMRKHGQKESLLYNKKIAEFKTVEDFTQEIKKFIRDKDIIVEQYSTEIYNTAKYYYKPKRKLFKLSRHVLITGIALFLVSFVVINYFE